jgi:hypothetical protein
VADFLRNRRKYELAEDKKDPAERKYELAERKNDLAKEKCDPAERKREQFFSWEERLSPYNRLHITPLSPIADPSGAKVQIIEKHLLETSATAHFGRLDQIQIASAEGELSRFPIRVFRLKSAINATLFIAWKIRVLTAGAKALHLNRQSSVLTKQNKNQRPENDG